MAADWSSPNMVADSSLTPDAQERLREVGVRLDFEPNQQIHREGERHAYLYLVQSGRFALSRIGRSGRRGIFWIVARGGTFGLSNAFLDEPLSSNCECIEAGQAVRVERAALANMIDCDRDVRWAVLTSLSRRIKFHTIALHEERMLPLSVRLGRRLIQVCDNHSQVHFNHTDIADLVGASRYAVGRVLRSFQDQGYVNVRYGCIEIADQQGIANYLSTQSDLG